MWDNFPDLFDYTRVVSIYREKFGHDNVIVLPYEMLRADPHAFTALIENKMGVKNSFKYSTEKVNASLDKKVLTAYRAVSNTVYRVIQPFPYKIQKVLYGLYIRQLHQHNLDFLFKIVTRILDKEESMAAMEGVLKNMAGKAEILRHEELYQPYLKEYLL